MSFPDWYNFVGGIVQGRVQTGDAVPPLLALAVASSIRDASLPPALAKKIIAGADYLKIAPKLVRVARDAPLPKVDLSLPKAPADLSAIYQFKERYALGASVDRLISALGW